MTLLETKVSKPTKEFTENYQTEKHRRVSEDPELIQTESGFHEISVDCDPYCEFRFLRK